MKLYDITPRGVSLARMHPAQVKCFHSRRRFTYFIGGSQVGKALALDTQIPTVRGFVRMGDITEGDSVFAPDGTLTKVIYVSPVYHERQCYRVTFDDGSSVVADADHQWRTQTANQRKNVARRVPPEAMKHKKCASWPHEDVSIVTTADIAASAPSRGGGRNHSIDLAEPFDAPDADLPVPPYTFGAWLGDGHSSCAAITSADPEVLDAIRSEGVPVGAPYNANAGQARGYRLTTGKNLEARRGPDGRLMPGDGVTSRLGRLGVLNNKHIPTAYMFASRSQRLALLRGLMDTDGYCSAEHEPKAVCEFTTISERLARDVMALLSGLGIKARLGRHSTGARRITFTTDVPVFALERKARRLPGVARQDTKRRYVWSCEPVDSVPVRCIAVDHPSHMYLCTEAFIPTHNTSFGPWWLYKQIAERGSGDYLAVSSTFPLFKKKMLPELRTVFEHVLRIGRYWSGDQILELRDPSGGFWAKRVDDPMYARIILGSAGQGGSLESATALAAWEDECGQDEFPLIAHEAIVRRLSLAEGPVLGTTTPYNLGWLKTEIYDRWRAGDSDYLVVQADSIANPSFPRAEYERAQRTMDAWKFDMMYRGLLTRPHGLIYSAFIDEPRSRGGHLVSADPDDVSDYVALPPEWPRYAGLDFGAVNTGKLWIAHDPATNVFYAYREALGGQMTTRQHCESALASSVGENMQVWIGGAPGETQQRWDWAAHGVAVQRPPVADVEIGINRVVELLRTRRLFVFDHMRQLRADLGSYSRVVGDDGQVTDKIKDKATYHLADCLRYVGAWLLANWPTPAETGEAS